jgi:cardiolipin synthase A/B
MVLLQRKKRKKGIFRTLRFANILKRNTEAAFSKGNKVVLFEYGGDYFPALFQAFRNAEHSILLEFYMIKNDGIGNKFADELLSAIGRGVNVSLIYDYIGCIDTPSAYFKRLEIAGVRCLSFNKPAFKRLQLLDKRDHRKIAIIDGKTAYLGGLNIGDEYAGYGESPQRWRDFGMRLDGPAVSELLVLFRDTWQKESPAEAPGLFEAELPVEIAGDADVMIVSGAPHHNRSIIRIAYRMAIAGASESVRIVTPYFIPGPRVVRSLLRAAARGVTVQIMLPAISDVPFVKLASRAYLSPLLKAGVEIYERQGTILHSKVMLIDSRWVTIGSANLDYRSFHRNYELNAIVDSRDFGLQVEVMITEDLVKSHRLTLQEHEARSWLERLLERLCDPIRRFL